MPPSRSPALSQFLGTSMFGPLPNTAEVSPGAFTRSVRLPMPMAYSLEYYWGATGGQRFRWNPHTSSAAGGPQTLISRLGGARLNPRPSHSLKISVSLGTTSARGCQEMPFRTLSGRGFVGVSAVRLGCSRPDGSTFVWIQSLKSAGRGDGIWFPPPADLRRGPAVCAGSDPGVVGVRAVRRMSDGQ